MLLPPPETFWASSETSILAYTSSPELRNAKETAAHYTITRLGHCRQVVLASPYASTVLP